MNPPRNFDPATVSQAALDVIGLGRARQALRLACAESPHLAGLAHLVRLKTHRSYDVAAIGASGLLVVNPDVFARLPISEAAFVMAHELMHLALDTHSRQGSADPHLVNVAHDYVINDMLADELQRRAPLNGLVWNGARHKSLEQLIIELSQSGGRQRSCWSRGKGKNSPRQQPGKSPMREALERAGIAPPDDESQGPQHPPPRRRPRGDLISGGHEAELEPELSHDARRQLRDQVRRKAAKALSVRQMRSKIDEAADEAAGATGDPQRGENLINALRVAYAPPWQLALQRWLDAVAPAGRTYSRASRRGADRDDLVLCGRFREGWCLHIVLDTSGSMADALPKVLGTIGAFCDAAGVAEVHMVQCDVEVTHDEWLQPEQLAEYRIGGYGGSDMSPGLRRLADDPEVSAVLVLTDGYIYYPEMDPPFRVLWGLFESGGSRNDSFTPSFGEVMMIDV